MISIVIPCHNSKGYLFSCFQCLQQQTEKNFQAIFIDDASSDNSFALLNELKKEASFDMQVYRNDKNLGAGGTRNKGIALSTGDYIMFLDSDDTLNELTVEKIKNVLHKEEPECVLFDFYVVKNKMKWLYRTNTIQNTWIDTDTAILNTNGSLCGKVYKKELLINNSVLFPGLKTNEDFVFNSVALSYCTKIYYLMEPLYYYIQNPTSIMHSSINAENDNLERAFNIIEKTGRFSASVLTELAITKRFYGETMTKMSLNYSKKDILRTWEFYDKKYVGWANCEIIKTCSKHMQYALKYIREKKYYSFKVLATFVRIAKKIVR